MASRVGKWVRLLSTNLIGVQIQSDWTDPHRRINHPGACTERPKRKHHAAWERSPTNSLYPFRFLYDSSTYHNLSYSLVSKDLGSTAVPLHGSFMPFGVRMWPTFLPTLCSWWWGVSTVQVQTEYTLSAAELLQKAFSWRYSKAVITRKATFIWKVMERLCRCTVTTHSHHIVQQAATKGYSLTEP